MEQFNPIKTNLTQIKQQISQAEKQFNRPSGSVKLLAVSKQKNLADIQCALGCGQIDFGENLVQEAVMKIKGLQANSPQPVWHFIGNIQSNKTKLIAEHFSWVHSLSRLKIAERLNQTRPESLPPLNVLIEVNIDQENSKSGIDANEVLTLAQAVSSLDKLTLRGLMVIPKREGSWDEKVLTFKAVTNLQQQLNRAGFKLDTLSMGMSNDFTAAIAAGSNLVRLGEAIFGARVPKR